MALLTMISGADDGRRWRWANIPLPKAHIGGLVVGFVFQRVKLWQLPISRRTSVIAGVSSIGLNVLIIGWSVLTVGWMDSRDPEQLVDRGPYAFSRNPMYVAWTGLYIGLAVLFRSVWMLLLTPVVAISVHFTIRREEEQLARSFGKSYRSYQERVPRYL